MCTSHRKNINLKAHAPLWCQLDIFLVKFLKAQFYYLGVVTSITFKNFRHAHNQHRVIVKNDVMSVTISKRLGRRLYELLRFRSKKAPSVVITSLTFS